MKLHIPIFLSLLLFVASCKDTESPGPNQNDGETSGAYTLAMVKSVSWKVGVIHKLEFTYNADSTLMYYLSGSSNLAQKYKTELLYNNKKIDEVQFEGVSYSKYIYENSGKVQELRRFNGSVETSRRTYSYSSAGKINMVKSEVLTNGSLRKSWESSFTYDYQGHLDKTNTVWFNESGLPADTILREFKEFTEPLSINPFSLLHPLYQHQVHELFDEVVLSQTARLPKKISESGRNTTGPINYEYLYTISDKLLNKVKCRITIGNNQPYDTAEAVFEY